MTNRRVDITKMYAHVYFDLVNQGKLGIAVYSVARIPGFAGEPSELIEEHFPGYSSAHELFVKTLTEGENPVKLSSDEIQQGKIFFLSEIGDKLGDLALKGKAQAQDPDANIVVNLDDPQFWLLGVPGVPPEKAEQIGNYIKEQEVDSTLTEPVEEYKKAIKDLMNNQGTEEKVAFVQAKRSLESALQRLYLVVSRITNPAHGGKAYPKRKSPPTIIFSEKYNIAYYPGFRGSPYMSVVPKSSKPTYVHKEEAEEPGKHWHKILIDNINNIIQPHSIDQVRVEVLDQITEVCARLFYRDIRKINKPSNEYKYADFDSVSVTVSSKGEQLLKKIDQSDLKGEYQKLASPFIGTWIDLYTGEVFDSLPALLSAKEKIRQPDEFAKAAGKLL